MFNLLIVIIIFFFFASLYASINSSASFISLLIAYLLSCEIKFANCSFDNVLRTSKQYFSNSSWAKYFFSQLSFYLYHIPKKHFYIIDCDLLTITCWFIFGLLASNEILFVELVEFLVNRIHWENCYLLSLLLFVNFDCIKALIIFCCWNNCWLFSWSCCVIRNKNFHCFIICFDT